VRQHRSRSEETLVSIVTPTLNRADSIEDVLASVSAQTHRSIEHIVIDGGSTDGTIDIVERFSRTARCPIQWISQPDTGMYDAINKGLRLARGDVLAYLNSDDLYFPWSVETAVRSLQGGCDFVLGDVAILTKRERSTDLRIQFYPRYDAAHSLHHLRLAQATIFWTREAMEATGSFNQDLRFLGDVEYWVRAGLAGLTFCRLDEVLALVVEHPAALSVRHADAARQELVWIQESFSDQLGLPRNEKIHEKMDAVRWRWRQRALRQQAKREDPTRWPAFIRFVREIDLAIEGSGTLVFLLPGAFLRRRPDVGRWFASPDDFERAILARIHQLSKKPRVALENGINGSDRSAT
jgi:glycosyltransferase involved in cell wall biosynthesis